MQYGNPNCESCVHCESKGDFSAACTTCRMERRIDGTWASSNYTPKSQYTFTTSVNSAGDSANAPSDGDEACKIISDLLDSMSRLGIDGETVKIATGLPSMEDESVELGNRISAAKWYLARKKKGAS